MLDARPVLHGPRIVLRPLAPSDLHRCVKWFSDPQVIRFLGRSRPVTLPEEEQWFRDYERKTDELIFAIDVDSVHIGNLGLHRIDRTHRKAEIGIVIGEREYWELGYGTEAMHAALDYAFGALGVHKVSLDVLEFNERAIRTYERLGFEQEGIREADVYKDGRFIRVMRMSLLAGENRRPKAP